MQLNLRKKMNEDKIFIGARIYLSDKERLDQLADAMGVNLTSVIRTAVNNLIDKELK